MPFQETLLVSKKLFRPNPSCKHCWIFWKHRGLYKMINWAAGQGQILLMNVEPTWGCYLWGKIASETNWKMVPGLPKWNEICVPDFWENSWHSCVKSKAGPKSNLQGFKGEKNRIQIPHMLWTILIYKIQMILIRINKFEPWRNFKQFQFLFKLLTLWM